MCIILDINILSSVFSQAAMKHEEFEPVLKWITEGHGRVVYGGTKYKKELRKTPYLKIFSLLNIYNRAIPLNDEEVDQEQQYVESLENDPDFDDPHIIAMVRVSGCKLLCSNDTRSIRFIRDKKFYTRPIRPPKFYTKRRNSSILKDENILPKYRCLNLRTISLPLL